MKILPKTNIILDGVALKRNTTTTIEAKAAGALIRDARFLAYVINGDIDILSDEYLKKLPFSESDKTEVKRSKSIAALKGDAEAPKSGKKPVSPDSEKKAEATKAASQ